MTIPRDSRLGPTLGAIRQPLPARTIREEKQVEGEGADTHADQHMGGSDPITAGGVGAAPLRHGHPPQHNLGATAAPAVTDDETAGYSVGSIWMDISTPKAYICIDATAGAADWNQIDAGGGGGDIGSDTIWDALGDMVYGSADDTGAKLAGNTTATKKYLTQTGDGMVSAAPGWNVIADADVPASHSGSAHHAADHKDRHDPQTGADPLDTAAPNDLFPDNVNAEGNADSLARSDHDHAIDCATPLEIAQVQAGAEGGDYNFARAEHAHAISHGVTDNHIVTIDDAGGLVAGEYPQCTASGLRSRSTTEMMGDLPTATTAQKGAVSELATVAEANTGTDTGRACTPDSIGSPKRTVILSAQGGKGTTTSGCDGPTQAETGATAKNYWYLSFAANEKAFWQGVMPANWDGDTVAMTAVFHWLGASGHSASDTVIWGIKAVDIGNDEVMTGAFGTQRTVTDTVITADRLHISGATASSIFPASPDGGELVIFEVERTGGTMTEEALLLAVHITYTCEGYSD